MFVSCGLAAELFPGALRHTSVPMSIFLLSFLVVFKNIGVGRLSLGLRTSTFICDTVSDLSKEHSILQISCFYVICDIIGCRAVSFIFIVQHSVPYVAVGITTVVMVIIQCFSFTDTVVSQMTPVIYNIQLFNGSQTLLLLYVFLSPLSVKH